MNSKNEAIKSQPTMIPFYLMDNDYYEKIKECAKRTDNHDTIIGLFIIASTRETKYKLLETVHYKDIAFNVDAILSVLENDKFIRNICKTEYKRFICKTSGLEIIKLPKCGLKSLIPSLMNLKERATDPKPLDELIRFFRYRDKEGNRTMLYVDPIKTPPEVFRRL